MTLATTRDYVYPNAAEFHKGERLRHSFYGEGSVLDVLHITNSDVIIVELDDKSKTPLGVGPYCRPDFNPWLGRKDILRLKYTTSEVVGVKSTNKPVGVKPADHVGVKPADDKQSESTETNEVVGIKPV